MLLIKYLVDRKGSVAISNGLYILMAGDNDKLAVIVWTNFHVLYMFTNECWLSVWIKTEHTLMCHIGLRKMLI